MASGEAEDPVSDLEAAFRASQTGKGLRLRGVEQLLRFDRHARDQGCVIRNLETYEERGDLELPRIDLGIYRGGHDDGMLPPEERIALVEDDLRAIVRCIAEERISCIFVAWTDDLD